MIRRSGDRVIYAECVALIATVGLLSEVGAACSKVSLGDLPLRVSAVSGTVVGNKKYAEASKPRKRLVGVRVQLLRRMDSKYTKDVVARKVRSSVQPTMIAEFSCTDVVATATSDDSGHFVLPAVGPGKYCIHFEGTEYETRNHTRMGERFLIDVDPAAKYRGLIADITPLWADCKGGGKIVYADQTGL